MGKEIDLPSGTKLTLNPAPFAEAKKLGKACAKELAQIKIDMTSNTIDLAKTIACIVFSSDEIEQALWPCLRRCLYAGAKIDDGTFEAEDARQDYTAVMEEVIKENALPFLKGLLLKLGFNLEALEKFLPRLKLM